MVLLAAFPPSARVVAGVLDGLGTVVGETSIDLQELLAGGGRVLRVRRVGGNDDRITDFARIDVRAYAASLSDAEETAELARQRLISGPSATPYGVLDRAETEVGPQEIPSPDPDRYRIVSATYRTSLRRRR